MAKHRLSHMEDPQVDPFSAGEPEPPWSSGDEPSADDLDPADGEGDLAAGAGPEGLGEDDGPADGNAGGTGPSDDGQDGGYVAPRRPDSHYDAPSTDERQRRRPRRSRRPLELGLAPEQVAALRAQVARRRRFLWALVVIVLVVSFAAPVASCVGDAVGRVVDAAGDAVEGVFAEDGPTGGWSDAFSDSDAGPYSYSTDADDEAALEALETRMEVLLADPSSGALHELVASHLSERMLSLLGYTADELGIDVDACATWYLGQVSFEMDSAYTYGSSGTAYAYVTAPDANAIVWDLNDEVSDYLLDNDLWGHYGSTDSVALPNAEQREHIRSAFDEVTAAAEPVEPVLLSAYVDYVGGEWVVDEQDLVDSLSDALWLY